AMPTRAKSARTSARRPQFMRSTGAHGIRVLALEERAAERRMRRDIALVALEPAQRRALRARDLVARLDPRALRRPRRLGRSPIALIQVGNPDHLGGERLRAARLALGRGEPRAELRLAGPGLLDAAQRRLVSGACHRARGRLVRGADADR